MTNAIAGQGMQRGVKPRPPADLWDQMDALRGAMRPSVPKDAFTYRDYAAQYKVGQSTAKGQVDHLVELGKLLRIIRGTGSFPSYFVISPKK